MKGKNGKEYPSDVAIAYKGTYQHKQSGETRTYLKVILKEDLEAGTEIVAFPVKRKKKNDSDPDFGFRLSEDRKKKSGGASKGRSAQTADDSEESGSDSSSSSLQDDLDL